MKNVVGGMGKGNCKIGRRRIRRRRRKIYYRMPVILLGLWTAVCIVLICSMLWKSVRSNASDGFKYYASVTVEDGDTLWKLTDHFIDYNHYKDKNSYIAEVARINHLNAKYNISAGQVLIFPYYSDEYIK